jgi:hypothetical protein
MMEDRVSGVVNHGVYVTQWRTGPEEGPEEEEKRKALVNGRNGEREARRR